MSQSVIINKYPIDLKQYKVLSINAQRPTKITCEKNYCWQMKISRMGEKRHSNVFRDGLRLRLG